jgi:hypothetical protein
MSVLGGATTLGSLTALGGTMTLNALNAQNTFGFTNATDTLNLASGGFIAVSTVGSASLPGRLTAGGSAVSAGANLYLSRTAGGYGIVHSNIVDNPNGTPVRAVYNLLNVGGGWDVFSTANSYTGGTVLNGLSQCA